MSNESVLDKIQNKKQNPSPNVNTLLKISLGLVFLTVLSSTLVYAETVDVEVTPFDADYATTGLTISNAQLDVELVVSTLVNDTPKTQCGPGTVLKNNTCVLDERCGPGTVLKNNTCVLDERCGPGTILVNGECIVEKSTSKSITISKAMGKELITGVITALVIAGIVGIILGIIAKASKKNN
jgi:ribosomal protein S27AE